MSAIRRLGEVSREYERMANEFEDLALRAAKAEAAHKSARAQAILTAKASAAGMSHAEAETRAEADPRVADLYMERLTTAALADSRREKLRQLKEQQANGRSAVAYERDVDKIHADGLSGAA